MSLRITFLLFTILFATSCQTLLDEPCVERYYIYEPVYQDLEAIRVVTYESSREIEQPGKIYLYGHYLFINEVNTGIHIIDNSNQSNPVQLGFYNIPGNNDLAIKDNILFADNYLDVMAIDISNMQEPEIIDVQEQVYDYPFHVDEVSQQFVVDFQVRDMEFVDCENMSIFEDFTSFNSSTNLSVASSTGYSTSPNLVGQAGSMARFALKNDFLYVVDNTTLHSIETADADNLSLTSSSNLDWGVETIFPYQDNLFIGAMTGMHIFSLADPSSPQFASTYTHFEACDPVVVKDDIAYVTVRSGTRCGDNRSNQLIELNVSDIYNPILLSTMSMTNPHGLGLLGDNLFICEAQEGVRVYNRGQIEDYEESKLADILNVHARDIILLSNETAIIMTDTGFSQYDVSDLNNIFELSNFML